MKALISPNEYVGVSWVVSWKQEDGQWVPDMYDSISNCQRVAEVQENEFPVALPMHWVDCPDDCKADQWYYKDGEVHQKPKDVPIPEDNLLENQGE
jgi:hypothetical protein